MSRTIAAAAAAAALLSAGAAQAACETDKAAADLSPDEAEALYQCLEADMHAGYVGGGKGWIDPQVVAGYRDWRRASTAPAAPGTHGKRFLVTWVNDVGYDAYTEFSDAYPTMPAGTTIAKESFSVSGGEAKAGPLFFMEKAAAGASPETGDWYYYMVSPAGAPQPVNVMTGCHSCHSEFFSSDNLGYPAEAVRVSR